MQVLTQKWVNRVRFSFFFRNQWIGILIYDNISYHTLDNTYMYPWLQLVHLMITVKLVFLYFKDSGHWSISYMASVSQCFYQLSLARINKQLREWQSPEFACRKHDWLCSQNGSFWCHFELTRHHLFRLLLIAVII